jgi:hypothetical protein
MAFRNSGTKSTTHAIGRALALRISSNAMAWMPTEAHPRHRDRRVRSVPSMKWKIRFGHVEHGQFR